MGTVVTVGMFAGLLFATRLPLLRSVQQLHVLLRRAVGIMVLLLGGWNVFWYASRHISERWGIAALVSGLLMMLTAFFILMPERLPPSLLRARPLVLILLLICALDYGYTIYSL